MIRVGNLLLETQGFNKLFFNMIKGGADAGGINDLLNWSEGDLSTCFWHFMCDVKTASSISANNNCIL